ncbi:MAG: hypothetical protein KAX47_09965 [Zoogloea sp.]|nr:hypothetical protein [Zoogloea sp.]
MGRCAVAGALAGAGCWSSRRGWPSRMSTGRRCAQPAFGRAGLRGGVRRCSTCGSTTGRCASVSVRTGATI